MYGIAAVAAAAAIMPLPAAPLAAQSAAQPAPAAAPAVMEVLLQDIQSVEEKLTALGEAIPEGDYAWRPGEGVRSVGEVLMHVAADNYFLPTIAGTAAPAATGIKSGDYPSVQAYEARSASKAEALAALRASFAHLEAAMSGSDQAMLDSSLNVFGNTMSGLQLWVLTTTHLHEHLGQMIAYARSNGVVPPWSQ
jgi:uncharacterized damage-inducible protein DinB